MKLNSCKLARGGLAVSASLLAIAVPHAKAQFPPAPGTGPGLAETIEAIDSARVTTRILYVTAHPDDESATLLTYLARGLHADVALLTLTRGEGGQNALGPEQAPQLGLIRTQELLAATRGYGVKLYFTRAPDFGFSKTPEETMKIWGDQVLGDMVRVIRTFRPDIVINGWGGVHGGHGHHQTSGLWTPKAVKLAADAKAFPEQLVEGLQPWGGGTKPVPVLDTERGTGKEGYTLPVDEISPLWGKSYREIALDAFVNHRSQGIAGFLGSPFLRRPLTLLAEEGSKFEPAILAEPLHSVGGDASGGGCAPMALFCPPLKQAEDDISRARAAALALDWTTSAEALAKAAQAVNSLYSRGHWRSGDEPRLMEVHRIQARIDRALTLVAGVEVTARADKSEIVRGESFEVTASSRCRKDSGCSLGELRLDLPKNMQLSKREGDLEKGYRFTVAVGPPIQPDPTVQALLPGIAHPVWDKLLPEPPPLVAAVQPATIAGYSFDVREPVIHIQASSTRVDKVALRIVPAYTVSVEPKQAIEVLSKPRKSFDVLLQVHSYSAKEANVTAGLTAPAGWKVSTAAPLRFNGEGDQYARITVSPPEKLAAGSYAVSAFVQRGGDFPGATPAPQDERFATSLEPLPSLPTQLWTEPAQCIVRAFEINVPENLLVGYITAEGEPIPGALERLGIRVEMLDAAALAFGNFSKYDAIIVGVRAYELRPDLPGVNQRLLDYVQNGGTLIVQYNRDYIWDKLQPAPYSALISAPAPPPPVRNSPAEGNSQTVHEREEGMAGRRGNSPPSPPSSRPLPRITDENAAVTFLKPDDSLLNRPNKITEDDFKGWVQERGLYFWTNFDSRYTALLVMHDPGEPDLIGGLVYAHYGKGAYIYTGLAFFRQLPDGVPGAYRLFVNLLSASRAR